jgi:transcription initiation factor IIF auxiliary subunit
MLTLSTLTSIAFRNPPFRIAEEGWGEFDMSIELTADKSYTIGHDLNFAQTRYESKHVIVSIASILDGIYRWKRILL